MTILGRSIVRSTGYIGGPGFNIIHWSAGVGPGPSDPGGVEEWHDTLEAALSNFVAVVPTGITLTIEPEVPYFDDSDGVLDGVTTDPGGARLLLGTGTPAGISRATQLVVRTRTEEFISGRRLQGRIFIGPIAPELITNDGQITSTFVADVPGFMSGLISGLGGRLAVWHRPTTPSGTDGSYGDVTSVAANSTPGTLRSRKT